MIRSALVAAALMLILLATAISAAESDACNIKGNHSRRGEWIYHLPGMPYYEQTRAEAMFCSEEDAIAAGYRRARVQR